MQIVDSQIHLWENATMAPHHRQIATYSVDDALQEMAEAGVDAAVIHPPSTLGEAVNVQAVDAARQHPDKFCILGHFDLQSPDRLDIVKNWRQRPGMLGFRFRAGRVADRPSGRRSSGRAGPDRRAPSWSEAAY